MAMVLSRLYFHFGKISLVIVLKLHYKKTRDTLSSHLYCTMGIP